MTTRWGRTALVAALVIGLAAAGPAASAQVRPPKSAAAKAGVKKKHPKSLHRHDLNTAAEAQLASVKGITPDLAKKIIAGRPYRSVDELSRAGLTKPEIDGARPFLTVGGLNGHWRKPAYRLAPGEKVNLNAAPQKVLEALPGIGPARAASIIEGRPYGRIEDVMKIKGIKKKGFARIRGLIEVK